MYSTTAISQFWSELRTFWESFRYTQKEKIKSVGVKKSLIVLILAVIIFVVYWSSRRPIIMRECNKTGFFAEQSHIDTDCIGYKQ